MPSPGEMSLLMPSPFSHLGPREHSAFNPLTPPRPALPDSLLPSCSFSYSSDERLILILKILSPERLSPRAREVAQWLRVLVAPQEALRSVPNTYMAAQNHLYL